jgi:hypothetical protein
MQLSYRPYGNTAAQPSSGTVTENAAPVNRIGAVSPAARETCRITPVRMPLIELGSTIVRMVCQRLAPMFQQASRKFRGTLCSASLVLVMITGKVITASVRDAANTDSPRSANITNAPTPNKAWTMLGTPARFTTARLMTRVNQLSRAYSLR